MSIPGMKHGGTTIWFADRRNWWKARFSVPRMLSRRCWGDALHLRRA